MPYLLWDASALSKRYTPETGSDVVKALFENRDDFQNVTTIWGYSETFSILLRRCNSGTIRRDSFVNATSALRMEIIESDKTNVLSIDDETVLNSLSMMQKHNLNSTDAALLVLYLRFQSVASKPCVLVAADRRFVRSAIAEGLPAIDPENFATADLPNFIASIHSKILPSKD